jgi:hypothetical protein
LNFLAQLAIRSISFSAQLVLVKSENTTPKIFEPFYFEDLCEWAELYKLSIFNVHATYVDFEKNSSIPERN